MSAWWTLGVWQHGKCTKVQLVPPRNFKGFVFGGDARRSKLQSVGITLDRLIHVQGLGDPDNRQAADRTIIRLDGHGQAGCFGPECVRATGGISLFSIDYQFFLQPFFF